MIKSFSKYILYRLLLTVSQKDTTARHSHQFHNNVHKDIEVLENTTATLLTMKMEFIFRGSAEDSINKVSNHVVITYTGMSFKWVAFFMHCMELYPEEKIT